MAAERVPRRTLVARRTGRGCLSRLRPHGPTPTRSCNGGNVRSTPPKRCQWTDRRDAVRVASTTRRRARRTVVFTRSATRRTARSPAGTGRFLGDPGGCVAAADHAAVDRLREQAIRNTSRGAWKHGQPYTSSTALKRGVSKTQELAAEGGDVIRGAPPALGHTTRPGCAAWESAAIV